MSSAPRPAIAEWLQATMDLLPRGIAWPRDPASNIGKVVQVVAGERAQRHDRKLVLLDVESFPPSAVDLLPDWERVAGLPDPCRSAPGTLAERRSELIDQLFGDHTPTPALMIALARRAGWDIAIREQRDFIAGISMAGDPVGESDFVWIVTVLGQSVSFFRAGQNAGGDPLWTWPDLSTLDCVLRRAAPAHTHLIFFVPPGEP